MSLYYDVPGRISGKTFKEIRQHLGMTQLQLAKALGYSHKIRVSEFERPSNRTPVPLHIGRAMLRMAADHWAYGKAVRKWEKKQDLGT